MRKIPGQLHKLRPSIRITTLPLIVGLVDMRPKLWNTVCIICLYFGGNSYETA